MNKTDGEKGRHGEREMGSSAVSLSPPLPLSLSRLEGERRTWDVILIGAGPAGAMAAYELARRSLRVLLVDKSAFPRPKVCGCCLNGQALELLQARGLGHVVRDQRAVPLHQLMLTASGHRAVIPLPAGVALSREALDMGLVNAAVEHDVAFLPQTKASLGELWATSRQVSLQSNGNSLETNSAVVLIADGLGGTPFEPAAAGGRATRPTLLAQLSNARENSRIGAAIIIKNGPAFYQPETIYMACGARGYVGLVRLEDGRLNIAAAFDRRALRDTGHPGRLATGILHEAGLPPVPNIADMPWKGTPRLTHRADPLAAERLFILGDAASFVEPFTGEGIAWALRSGVAVAPFALEAVRSWNSDLETAWTSAYHRVVERRQITCRLTSAALRHPHLTNVAVRLLSFLPFLSRPVLRQLNKRQQFRGGKFSTCRKELGQVENLPPHVLGTGISP